MGSWSHPPSFSAENNRTGDIEFQMAANCETFEGRWRTGRPAIGPTGAALCCEGAKECNNPLGRARQPAVISPESGTQLMAVDPRVHGTAQQLR